MTKQDFIQKYIGWVSYTDREKLKKEMYADLNALIEALQLCDVISRFFKEMAEKHKVKVDDLNIHISYNQLYIQEYTPNQRNEFKCLEIVDLNGL